MISNSFKSVRANLLVMEYDLDPATALYGIAAFLGAVTVLYFGSSLIFDLSPVTKSLAFFSSFIIFLAVSMYLSGQNRIRTLIALGMTGVSYLAFLSYTLGKFNFSEEGVFVSLFLSSILFVVLGHLSNTGRLQVDKKHLKYLLGTVILVGGLFMVFDVVSAQPTQSLELQDNVTLEPDQETVIGTLTVTNNFVLPREFSEPNFDSCLGEELDGRVRGMFTDIQNSPDTLSGSQELSLNMTLRSPPREVINETRTFNLERSDSCPSEGENNTVYIFEDSDDQTIEYVD